MRGKTEEHFGYFYFYYGNRTGALRANYFNENVEKIEELMAKHYEFYGQFKQESEYVTSGSLLCCTAGSKLTRFDIPTDHGVTKGYAAIGVCNDCTPDNNVYSFGSCKLPTPAGYPYRNLITIKEESDPSVSYVRQICVPMLAKSWQNQDKENLHIYDSSDQQYHEVLTTGAFLTCFYGGLINVVEVLDGKNILGDYTLSHKGKRLLKYIELPYPPYSNDYLNYFIMNGIEIKAIYFYYAGDWGITIGWGTYVATVQGHSVDTNELSKLKKHGMTDDDISKINDIIKKYKNVSTSEQDKKKYFKQINTYLQTQNLKAPIEDCNDYLDERVDNHISRLNELKDNDYASLNMNQNQFDALVINRYCRGRIYQSLDAALKTGNANNVTLSLFQQPNANYNDRGQTEYNIFKNGIYSYQGVTF